MAYEPGDVVLVPFPYRDRDATSTRPAVVVSSREYNETGDLVIAGITSHTPRSSWDYALQDWKASGLRLVSTVRMLLATVATSRVQLTIGSKFNDGFATFFPCERRSVRTDFPAYHHQ